MELGRKWKPQGYHLWARGYFVSTVGPDEKVVREYIRDQEREELRQELLFE